MEKRFLLILHRFLGLGYLNYYNYVYEIIIDIYIIYRLTISSNNKIKIEQWLFRFLFTSCHAVRLWDLIARVNSVHAVLLIRLMDLV